jgi:RNA polymerase sigma-70 factor (ECF subfamily)
MTVIKGMNSANIALATPLSSNADVTYSRPMTAEPEDSALMLRYGDGDVDAFEVLYRRHNDALYRYLLRLSRHPATAEDVFQEVWSKIINSRSRYRPTAKFTTFLYRVAHNCFIDHVRRNRKHASTADVDPDAQPDNNEGLEAETERELARRRMLEALAELPEDQRDAFLLREEAGLTLDEIAHVTGANRETAKSRLRYAVNKLKSAMNDAATGAAPGGEE